MTTHDYIPLKDAARHQRQEWQAEPRPFDQGPPAWEAEPEPSVRVLPVCSYTDLEAVLETSDFVEGLLVDGQVSQVFGPSNAAKSFLVIDVALHVALGWPWHGRAIDGGGVLYVAGEGGAGIRNRVAAFRKHHGGAAAGEVPFAVIPATIDLRNPNADTGSLIVTIRAVGDTLGLPVRLIIVDTVSRAMAGGDENDSAAMGALVRNVDRIRQETGVHVMLVHHSGKDASKGARGHSLLRAAVDTEIEVTRDHDSGLSTAKVVKQRDLPKEGELIYRLEVVELGVNRRGKPVTSCVVVAAAEEGGVAKEARLSPRLKRAFDVLQNCLADLGRTISGNPKIPAVPLVRLEEWRDYLKRAGVTNRDKPASERSQWSSIQEGLFNKGFIASWDSFVWIARRSETERDIPHPSHAGARRDETPPKGGDLAVSPALAPLADGEADDWRAEL